MPEVTTTAPAPAPAASADRPEPPRAAAPVSRLVLARHAVTAQTGPLLSGRLPGIDLSDDRAGRILDWLAPR